MLKIALCGAKGKMGQAIVQMVKASSDCQIVLEIDRYDRLLPNTQQAQLVIDFSSAEGCMAILEESTAAKLPMVIGTTGLSERELKVIEQCSTHIPILNSPNMSLGMNLMIRQAAVIAKALGSGFDVDIVDVHHHQKKDAPSGSAKKLRDSIAQATPSLAEKIHFHSLRTGTVVGDHQVIFGGNQEQITLKHQAFSRDIFASGALQAARWLIDKPAGLYSMQDMLTERLGGN